MESRAVIDTWKVGRREELGSRQALFGRHKRELVEGGWAGARRDAPEGPRDDWILASCEAHVGERADTERRASEGASRRIGHLVCRHLE